MAARQKEKRQDSALHALGDLLKATGLEIYYRSSPASDIVFTAKGIGFVSVRYEDLSQSTTAEFFDILANRVEGSGQHWIVSKKIRNSDTV